MKRLLLLLIFSVAVAASAAEVDVTLKNGKKVTGAVLAQDDEKMVILVTASNGVYRQTINKTDILDIKDHATAPQQAGPVGPKDLESLQRRAKAAEEEFRHRDKLAAKAQETLDAFVRSRQRAKESVLQRASLDKRETELRTRLSTARTRAEAARSNFKTLSEDLETMNQKLAEPEQQPKKKE
ncbi:MAG: hypothetical protein NT105_00545 [Verrucomicrobia bacterium]|nr:hypothetical protein [Verrucomicrobiota bacterium]